MFAMNEMELNLTFKEKEFRAIYEDEYEQMRQKIKQPLKKRTRIIFVSALCTILFFGLRYFDQQWFSYGLSFLTIAIIFILYTLFERIKGLRKVRKHKETVDDFVLKTKAAGNIKYRYDEESIYYYENNTLKDTLLWRNVSCALNNNKCLILYFKTPVTNIMVPKAMTDVVEIKKFEEKIQEKVKPIS